MCLAHGIHDNGCPVLDDALGWFTCDVEDMIVTKLRWAVEAQRAKDRDDVRNMVAVRGDSLDWRYIRQWCTVHRTLGQLEAIRSTIPPA